MRLILESARSWLKDVRIYSSCQLSNISKQPAVDVDARPICIVSVISE